jgi:hypothetical protein
MAERDPAQQALFDALTDLARRRGIGDGSSR